MADTSHHETDTASTYVLGRSWQSSFEASEGDAHIHHRLAHHLEVNCSYEEDDEVSVNSSDPLAIQFSDRAKHCLLSVRLQKAYFFYCGLCFVLSAVVCISNFHRAATSSGLGFAKHRWLDWEAVLETLIGLAVCTETFTSLWLKGRKAFLQDWLCIFDALVATLTLVSWALLAMRKILLAENMIEVDLPILVLRFLLQPFRMISTVSAIRRVRQMQDHLGDLIHCSQTFLLFVGGCWCRCCCCSTAKPKLNFLFGCLKYAEVMLSLMSLTIKRFLPF
eukprot:TRINITY_DN25600_c0_g1_i1.p1 TRINITY_DN25600_c0_g1~~TRINITY_DN25600_c0_g1_i1.p1  ORF type:complete len:278 (+),score=22.52 TRINITY_DN25600_c0_g1_i1:106-939(+)